MKMWESAINRLVQAHRPQPAAEPAALLVPKAIASADARASPTDSIHEEPLSTTCAETGSSSPPPYPGPPEPATYADEKNRAPLLGHDGDLPSYDSVCADGTDTFGTEKRTPARTLRVKLVSLLVRLAKVVRNTLLGRRKMQ